MGSTVGSGSSEIPKNALALTVLIRILYLSSSLIVQFGMAIRPVMTGDVKLRARVLFPTLTFHINNSLYCIDIALPQQRKSPYIHLYLFYPHTHTQAPLKVRGPIIQQGYSRRIRHLVISSIVDTSVMMSGALALYKGGPT